jgi:hypothetical protein
MISRPVLITSVLIAVANAGWPWPLQFRIRMFFDLRAGWKKVTLCLR